MDVAFNIVMGREGAYVYLESRWQGVSGRKSLVTVIPTSDCGSRPEAENKALSHLASKLGELLKP